MTVKTIGTPNYQRLAETVARLLAAKDGMEVVPGSVKVLAAWLRLEIKEK